MKRFSWASYIIFGLMAIGVVGLLIEDTWSIVLPVVVIGGIFLLVKYPPAFLSKNRPSSTRKNTKYVQAQQFNKKSANKRSKPIPFKVIEGGKDDSDTPRYH